jgi:cytochrome P450
MVTLDLSHPRMRSDPHPEWARLREAGPVHRDESGAWLVVRHEPVAAMLRDPRLGKDLRRLRDYASSRPYGAGSLIEQHVEQWIKCRLPPAHARWRRSIADALSHQTIAVLRPQVQQIADSLLASLPTHEPFDFIARFARQFPIRVIARAMALPWLPRDQLVTWTTAVGRVLEPDAPAADHAAAAAALSDLLAYLHKAVDDRRRHPGDDLLSHLLLQPRDDGIAQTIEELVATILLLLLSGDETSANLVANGVLALLRYPDQLERLRSQPKLMPSAVEEVLRHAGPACIVLRATYEPVRIARTTIPEGELVLLVLASANRDPTVFEEPDRFDVGRKPAGHLAFGGGDHRCVGSAIARMEATVALAGLISRFPQSLRHDEAGLEWLGARYLHGLERMVVAPVSFPV